MVIEKTVSEFWGTKIWKVSYRGHEAQDRSLAEAIGWCGKAAGIWPFTSDDIPF